MPPKVPRRTLADALAAVDRFVSSTPAGGVRPSLMDVLGPRSLAAFRPARPDHTTVNPLLADFVRDVKVSSNKQRTQDVINSPMADSLWATMNNNAPASGPPPSEPRYGGVYRSATRDLGLSNSQQGIGGLSVGRNTVIHEAGHHYDNLNGGMTKRDNRYDFPEMAKEDSRKLPFAERKARNRVDSYYRTNPAEGFAQAYTAAYKLLSEPLARSDRNTAMRRLADIEGRTPGAGEIVRDLLKKDIFRGHPLSEFVR